MIGLKMNHVEQNLTTEIIAFRRPEAVTGQAVVYDD
jgi:hypothetical protein